MKRFIKHIIIFGAVLICILLVGDVITTYMFHQKAGRKYGVWNDIIYTDIDANVLIMGNSRAWRQYDTHILDSILKVNSYNIGIDGSCFNRQIIRYKVYRHYQHRKPDYIIQNVEFFTLGHTLGYEREQFMPYLHDSYFRKLVTDEEPMSFGELYIPMYRYYVNNFYDEYTKFDFSVYKGYAPEIGEKDKINTDDIDSFEALVDEQTKEQFMQYIEDVQHEGIRLIFVLAPILYDDVEAKVVNLEEVHQIFFDLAQQYQIPILDYSKSWISYDQRYFYNSTHLNKLGAEAFTERLAKDLDSLDIIRK